MQETNQRYWQNKSGDEYKWQQLERTTRGNPSYIQQERWLTTHFQALAAKLGRPVRALEFGCGFGRFARLFVDNKDVRYHGYDFSQTMVQPLREDPPAGLTPLESRIRVAETVVDAFPDIKFDVVFTVSVLIHNPPEVAERLCGAMTSMLTPDGQLWLVENALTSLSTRENNWHGGCWVHDFAGTTATNMDICVYHEWIHNHAVYVLSRLSASRVIELARGQDSEPRESSLDELRLLGLPRLREAIALLDGEVAQYTEAQTTAHDLGEKIQYLEEDLSLITHAAIDTVDTLRGPGQPSIAGSEKPSIEMLSDVLVSRVKDLQERSGQLTAAQQLRTQIVDALAASRPPEPRPQPQPHPTGPEPEAVLASPFDWDADQDLQMMNLYDGFGEVCHIFNREWMGIRAAAGALPGHKLAISAKRDLSAIEMARANDTLQRNNIKTLVIHGMSEPLHALILSLAKTGSFKMFLVWHGAAAMWIMEHERKLAALALDLTKRGIIKSMNAMRLGMEPIIGERAYPKLLLNMPPRVENRLPELTAQKMRHTNAGAIAFIPSWHLLHKNVATCLLAAHITPEVRDIWLLDNDIANRLKYNDKVKILGPRHGRAMLETMRQADVVINVSLIDCHPMIDLEALAVGTPCLRGPLFLDALEEHPYVKLTETKNVLSVADISRTFTNVLTAPSNELIDMMNDYKDSLIKISASRYREFLEL